ncbi:MAG: membrane-bound lytic murein transglycosylase MltF [Gammaproteobacteria bacterium]|nr:membrane-bound lytic murein transglycosylase MltF [Gammaproteobacteria bacterium]
MSKRLLLSCILPLLLASCSIPDPLVERIKESGELRVVTRSNPTTYYEDKAGIRGLEYELVTLFARKLGVTPRFIFTESHDQILPIVARGDAHFAAAGLTATRGRENNVRFTRSYQSITQQLVYREGTKKPKKITDTLKGTLEVMAGSSHAERLQELKHKFPELEWTAKKEVDSEELVSLVLEQIIDYTVSDSNEVALSHRFHPELKVAFDISEPQPLAWAFQHAEDDSLFDAAQSFLQNLEQTGELKQIIDRYYGYVDNLGALDTRTFRRHIAQRLPKYIAHFKKAALETGLDWRLLAAIGYQESHWNPKAVSPTGVKGIMMLTKAAAKELGVESRTNPKQSIFGGARYILLVRKKIPDRIQNPDRLWMALAGYNVGFGHLEDARILTERHGDNPDRWVDVKKYLPLLSKKKYYKTVKRGKARGREPVIYVDNVRSYYDLLVWENNRQETPVAAGNSVLSKLPSAM